MAEVLLEWTPPASLVDVSNYAIYRVLGAETDCTVIQAGTLLDGSVNKNAVSYTDDTALLGQQYSYAVFSQDAGGVLSACAQDTITVPLFNPRITIDSMQMHTMFLMNSGFAYVAGSNTFKAVGSGTVGPHRITEVEDSFGSGFDSGQMMTAPRIVDVAASFMGSYMVAEAGNIYMLGGMHSFQTAVKPWQPIAPEITQYEDRVINLVASNYNVHASVRTSPYHPYPNPRAASAGSGLNYMNGKDSTFPFACRPTNQNFIDVRKHSTFAGAGSLGSSAGGSHVGFASSSLMSDDPAYAGAPYVTGWGANDKAQQGDYTTLVNSCEASWHNANWNPNLYALEVACGGVGSSGGFTFIRLVDGTVKACGLNHHGQLGLGYNNGSGSRDFVVGWQTVSLGGSVIQISCGGAHTLFLMADGTVKSTGHNGWGQLGDGTTTSRNTPATISGLTNIQYVHAGMAGNSFFVDTGNDVWGVGRNNSGQLGTGDNLDKPNIVQLTGLT